MSHNLGGGMTTDDEDLIDFRKNEEIYKAFYEGIIDEPFEGSSDGLSRVTKNTFGQPFPENFEKFSKFHRIFLKFFFEFFIEYPFFSIFQYFFGLVEVLQFKKMTKNKMTISPLTQQPCP